MSRQSSVHDGPLTDQRPAPTRRRFYLEAIYALWGSIGATLAIPAFVYLFFPPRLRRQDEWVQAADLSKLPLNSPEEVVFRRNRVDGWKITSEKTSAWVVKSTENHAIAFAPQCTHLGCAYHWDERNHRFICPCHSSTFGLDGNVLSGPAPRPLDRYTTRVEGDHLEIGPLDHHA